LKIFKVESYPTDYARTQVGFGEYYLHLSQIRDKEENLDNAIAAFEEALKIFTLDSYPDDYSLVKNKLEEAYLKLSEINN
jgi:tetratricopeptide (TPR) repeat protein